MPIVALSDVSGPTGVDAVVQAAGKVVEFSGTMLDTVVSNPILLFFFAAGIVGIGVSVISSLIGLSRRA